MPWTSGGEKIAPDFAPVEVQGEGGTLWVDRAWSDGVSLVLDLRLDLGDYGVSLYQQAPGLELVPAYGEVTLNGQMVARGASPGQRGPGHGVRPPD